MRHALLTILWVVAGLGWATGARAQGTITDGNANFVRTDFDTTPAANFTGVSSTLAQDHLFEAGWWFRVSGDTQEAIFGAPNTQLYGGDTSTLTWNDVQARGLFGAQEVSILKDSGLGGFVRMTMTITNLNAGTPLTIDIFHMIDIDLNGAASDSGVLLAHPNHIGIADPSGNVAEYKGGNGKAFLVRPFGGTSVRTVLNDTAVTDFGNTGLPFGPGDITGGLQWSATIPPSGSQSFTAILAVNQHLSGGDLNFDGMDEIVTGAGAGGGPHVRAFSGADSSELASLFAYDAAFTGGVRVATGDINGDGRADIVTGAGVGGGPHVRVFSGADLSELRSFFAYDAAFTGGVYVAAGDVSGDGTPDIITGAGAGGGPHVRVFDGVTGSQLGGTIGSFLAYDAAFTGGVRVAASDVNGDGMADIITGAGAGGGPHVRVFSGADASLLASLFAYDAAFTGGVYVAAGDVNGDNVPDIITGAGAGGGPHVRAFSGADLSELRSFLAYDAAFTGGVRVAAGDVNGDGQADIITGAGAGGGPHVRAFSGADLSELASFFGFDVGFTGGVFVE